VSLIKGYIEYLVHAFRTVCEFMSIEQVDEWMHERTNQRNLVSPGDTDLGRVVCAVVLRIRIVVWHFLGIVDGVGRTGVVIV